MAWTIRQSISLAALAACLASGMAAHAAGESATDKLKAQAGSGLGLGHGLGQSGTAPTTDSGSALQKLSGSGATGLSGSSNGASALGGALGGSAGAGALGGSATSGALGASALSGLGLPNIASSSAGNVAGVLEYCVKNNYLKKANVDTLKEGLLSKAGLGKAEPEKDSSYASGLGGLLTGGDGKSFNLNSIQDNVKEKACDYVLDNATSLL